MQLIHSEEHRQQVEEVLTYLPTDLSVEERMRIGKGQCTVESGLVCPCIEVFPISKWVSESYNIVLHKVHVTSYFRPTAELPRRLSAKLRKADCRRR